jgi:hypothetical protein
LKNKPAKIKSKPKSLRAVRPGQARADKANWGGPRPGAGRPKGSTNVFSREIKESIIRAANTIGRDGRGAGGMDGYMERVALTEVAQFCGLLRGVMGTQASVEHTERPRNYQTLDEVLAELRAYGIIPMEQKTLPRYVGPEIELEADDVARADQGDDET